MANRYGYVPTHRPRDSGTMWAKFLKWNVWGEGKRLSSYRAATYWYKDEVFYANFRPKARVVIAPSGNAAVFIKRTAHFRGVNDEEAIPREYQFTVDEIGVSGPYDDTKVPEDEFLLSALAQCVGRAKLMIEVVGRTAPREASQYFRLMEEHKIRALTYDFRSHPYDPWSDQIKDAGLTYARINELFELGQPDVNFGDWFGAFWSIVENKAAIHDSPANVRKRERAAARKEAAIALGVNDV